jgi:prepilin peptidase CpaA
VSGSPENRFYSGGPMSSMLSAWPNPISPALLLAGAGFLFFAALHDIVARTVPNGISMLLALIGLGARIMDGTIVIGLAIAAAVFVIAAFLWRRGWMGGGDVKLLGASALLVPSNRIFTFIVATSVAGSLFAALYLAAGRIARTARKSAMPAIPRQTGLFSRAVRAELWRLRRGGPLPYACAIAAGFIFILF